MFYKFQEEFSLDELGSLLWPLMSFTLLDSLKAHQLVSSYLEQKTHEKIDWKNWLSYAIPIIKKEKINNIRMLKENWHYHSSLYDPAQFFTVEERFFIFSTYIWNMPIEYLSDLNLSEERIRQIQKKVFFEFFKPRIKNYFTNEIFLNKKEDITCFQALHLMPFSQLNHLMTQDFIALSKHFSRCQNCKNIYFQWIKLWESHSKLEYMSWMNKEEVKTLRWLSHKKTKEKMKLWHT